MTEQKIFVGCQAWGYDAWVSRPGQRIFYPQGTRNTDKLSLYSAIFDLIELDTAVYGVPKVENIQSWYAKTPPGFIFAPKLPNEVTHRAELGPSSWRTFDEFCANIRTFSDKLGPNLVLLPKTFDFNARNFNTLEAFLDRAPRDLRFALEFRHDDWINDRTLSLLRNSGVALALEQGRGLSKEVVIEAANTPTTDFTYIRFSGPRDITEFDRNYRNMEHNMAEWAQRIREMPVGEAYVLMSNFYEGHSPASANKMKEFLGLPVKDPLMLETQQSLF